MAMVTDGADVARLRQLAAQLLGSGNQIDDVAASGSQQLTMLVDSWSGPDMEHFATTWPDVERSIAAASEMVRGMGRALQRNADQQDDASAGGSGGAGSGGRGAASGGPGGSGSGGNASGDPHWTDPDDEVYGEVDPEIEAKWDQMTDDERDAVLDAIIREQAARYGIDPPPDITYDPSMKSNEYGVWREGSKELVLNPDLLDDPQMSINTIVHEMRHAGQHEAIRDANPGWWESLWGAEPEYRDGMTREQVEAWKENFPDYKSEDNGDTFQEYWDQPVEVDAREAGRDYVNDLSPEEFDDLVQDAQDNTPEPGVPQPTEPPKLPGPPGVDPSPTPPSPSPGPSPTPSPTGSRGRDGRAG